MKLTDNPDGTRTAEFQFTDRCGIDLKRNDLEADYWTLTFYDDGDPVVFPWVSRWQLEHLHDAISDALKGKNDRR